MGKLKKIKSVFLFIAIVLTAAAVPVWARSAEGLEGRLIVGYQGWFGCPGDYKGNARWMRWFHGNVPDAGHLSVDLLPSVREFDKKDLCDTGLRRADGSPVRLYSAQNPDVVDRHFRWMAEHGIDGAALQRFIGPVTRQPEMRERSDHMISNARAAAEKNGRVFFITYDISGGRPGAVTDDIRRDWMHLVKDLKVTESPAYLNANGKPVIEIWGFGLGDRPGAPDDVEALIRQLKGGLGGLQAVTLIGGVPTNWRTLTEDSKKDPGWAKVYRSYDVISPWSVGRFKDDAGADAFLRDHVLPDLAETKRLGIGYMPVIFPGFSWVNEQRFENPGRRTVLNQIPRRCGKFLWRQVYGLLGAHVNMLYGAMFDEVDEGTALMPVETRADKLPAGARMVYLNDNGCSLPDDWYLRVVGKTEEFLKNGQTPPEDLNAVLNP